MNHHELTAIIDDKERTTSEKASAILFKNRKELSEQAKSFFKWFAVGSFIFVSWYLVSTNRNIGSTVLKMHDAPRNYQKEYNEIVKRISDSTWDYCVSHKTELTHFKYVFEGEQSIKIGDSVCFNKGYFKAFGVKGYVGDTVDIVSATKEITSENKKTIFVKWREIWTETKWLKKSNEKK